MLHRCKMPNFWFPHEEKVFHILNSTNSNIGCTTKSPKSSTEPAPASRSMFCSQPKQNVNPTLDATLPKQNTLKLPQSNVGFINLCNTCYAKSMNLLLSL